MEPSGALPSMPYGDPMEFRDCPDCGTGVDEPHRPGCDVERCTVCMGQRLMGCECADHDPQEAAWRGVWPGVVEAAARGWFARMSPAGGWEPCAADDPGAMPDLNRLSYFEQTGRDGLYGGSSG